MATSAIPVEVERHISAFVVVSDIYPQMMRQMILNSSPPGIIAPNVQNVMRDENHPFTRSLNENENEIMGRFATEGYNKCDVSLMYKLIRHFGLVEPPTRGWGNNPLPGDVNRGDDVERMKRNRNDIVHRPGVKLSENEKHNFFQESEGIARRIDSLIGNPANGFQHRIQNVKIYSVTREKYTQVLENHNDLKERFERVSRNLNVNLYYGHDIEVKLEAENVESSSGMLSIHEEDMHNVRRSTRKRKPPETASNPATVAKRQVTTTNTNVMAPLVQDNQDTGLRTSGITQMASMTPTSPVNVASDTTATGMQNCSIYIRDPNMDVQTVKQKLDEVTQRLNEGNFDIIYLGSEEKCLLVHVKITDKCFKTREGFHKAIKSFLQRLFRLTSLDIKLTSPVEVVIAESDNTYYIDDTDDSFEETGHVLKLDVSVKDTVFQSEAHLYSHVRGFCNELLHLTNQRRPSNGSSLDVVITAQENNDTNVNSNIHQEQDTSEELKQERGETTEVQGTYMHNVRRSTRKRKALVRASEPVAAAKKKVTVIDPAVQDNKDPGFGTSASKQIASMVSASPLNLAPNTTTADMHNVRRSTRKRKALVRASEPAAAAKKKVTVKGPAVQDNKDPGFGTSARKQIASMASSSPLNLAPNTTTADMHNVRRSTRKRKALVRASEPAAAAKRKVTVKGPAVQDNKDLGLGTSASKQIASMASPSPLNLAPNTTTTGTNISKIPQEQDTLEEKGKTTKVQQTWRLVFVGKTGSGKSTTGNTILGRTSFNALMSASSVTNECQREIIIRNGSKYVIVDTPGFFDTRMSNMERSKEVARGVSMSSPGPHIFLLIVSVGRFTREDTECFIDMFELFGENLNRYSLIVFTGKDQLELEERSIDDFISGCNELQNIISMCNNNYIAINNKATGEKLDYEREFLMQKIDSVIVSNHNQHYTHEIFKEAEIALKPQKEKIKEEAEKRKQQEYNTIRAKMRDRDKAHKLETKKMQQKITKLEKERDIMRKQSVKRDAAQIALVESTIESMKETLIATNEKHNRVIENMQQNHQKVVEGIEQRSREQMKAMKDSLAENLDNVHKMYSNMLAMYKTRLEYSKKKIKKLEQDILDKKKRCVVS